MRAGELRHRVQILAPVEVRLDSQGFVLDWTCILTVWAKIKPLSGREFYASKQVDSDVTHEITTRYNSSGLNSSYRLCHGFQIFELSSKIDVLELGQQFTAKCTERTGTIKEVILANELTGDPLSWDDDNCPVFMDIK